VGVNHNQLNYLVTLFEFTPDRLHRYLNLRLMSRLN
jgi:hypothetical protein